jgi:hypothetical protein
MIDREFFEKQLAKYKGFEAEWRDLASKAAHEQERMFFLNQADRAAAYASDYEQDLAK